MENHQKEPLPPPFNWREFDANRKEQERETDLMHLCIRGIQAAIDAGYITQEHGDSMIRKWFNLPAGTDLNPANDNSRDSE